MWHEAYVLHAYPYRDTSLLVDLFTAEYGRVAAVARGARRIRSGWSGLIQPFKGLLVEWFGKQDLVTLKKVEPIGTLCFLAGKALIYGFYLNELLVRLLPRRDPHPRLFKVYQDTLQKLSEQEICPLAYLRIFEKRLLEELGYGLKLNQTADTRAAILPEHIYLFKADNGFISADGQMKAELPSHCFRGQSLLDLHAEYLTHSASLADAKRLMRLALQPLLGTKPLVSRELLF